MAENPNSVASDAVTIEWLADGSIVDLRALRLNTQADVIAQIAARLDVRLPCEANRWLASGPISFDTGNAVGTPLQPAANLHDSRRLRACWLAPGQWWLLMEGEPDARSIQAFESVDADIVATEVGDASSGVRLTGPGVIALLSQGCPLDLQQMAAGHCARTLLARASVLLIAVASDGTAFELWVERSYRNYLEGWLSAALEATSLFG